MLAYKTDVELEKSGTLVLHKLPFEAGDHVEIIVRKLPAPRSLAQALYPLRGQIMQYDDPCAPVASSDWEVLQ
jgi:hypothetical protein